MTLSKRLERTYFALAVVGLLLTWYFNLQFFADGGSVAPHVFLSSAFANPLTTAITLDVYWSAIVFSFWVFVQKDARPVSHPWIHVVLCFAVGLAFAFPLYLGIRARRGRLARQQAAPARPEAMPARAERG